MWKFIKNTAGKVVEWMWEKCQSNVVPIYVIRCISILVKYRMGNEFKIVTDGLKKKKCRLCDKNEEHVKKQIIAYLKVVLENKRKIDEKHWLIKNKIHVE